LAKKLHEKSKLQESQQYRAISWAKVLAKWAFYLGLAVMAFTFIGPMVAMNYISSQIKSGEWGADFKPKTSVEEAIVKDVKKQEIYDEVEWRNYFEGDKEPELDSWFDYLEKDEL
jgi:hypothetical protein